MITRLQKQKNTHKKISEVSAGKQNERRTKL
jgi:hypothetical protein